MSILSKMLRIAGRGPDGNAKALRTNADGDLLVAVNGSLPKSQMEYYGATVADRPAANTVPVGAVYMAVNSGEVWQSNGISWVVM